jgi:uncharacterized protein YndB with AHSA1/START domain
MEYGSIEREVHIEASPEVVFEVITSPEHIKDWWEPGEVMLMLTCPLLVGSDTAVRLLERQREGACEIQPSCRHRGPPRMRWSRRERSAARPSASMPTTS